MKEEELLPSNGELYGLIEFADMCKDGLFTDGDGYAYYSDGRIYWKDERAIPSDLIKDKIKYNLKFRYILWLKN